MFKRLNLFALIVLIIGQTIIGPIGSVGAVGGEKTEEARKDTDKTEEIDKDKNEGTEESTDEETTGIDRDELASVLEDAEQYTEADYTEDTFKAFVEAVAAGKNIYEDNDATEEDVNEAVDAITEAIGQLERKDSVDDDGDGTGGNGDGNNTGLGDEKKEGEQTGSGDDSGSTPISPASAGGFGIAATENGYEDEILLTDDDIEKINFTVRDGEPFESDTTTVSNGDKFNLEIHFKEIHNSRNYGVGTEIKYKLPESFLDSFDINKDEMPDGYGGIGSLELKDGFLIITPDERILDSYENPMTITAGNFSLSGIFIEENEDWEKEVEMPGGEEFTVNFVPKTGEGHTITKSGEAYRGDNKTDSKSDRIKWTVQVNTNRGNPDSAVFKDTLSAAGLGQVTEDTAHKFDRGSLIVKELNVSPTGEITDGPTVSNPDVEYNDEITNMKINLEQGKAYEITYTTLLDDPGVNESVNYKNDANYGGNLNNKTVKVDFGKAIEKNHSGPETDLITNWTITYNGNERVIPSETELTDSWGTTETGADNQGKQVIVDDSGDKVTSNFKEYVKVTNPNGNEVPNYSVNYDEDEEEFVLTFKEVFDYTIEITYKTKPEGMKASEDFNVTNTVTHDINDVTDEETAEYKWNDLTLRKSTDGIDYHEQKLGWKIVANQAKYELAAGTKFEDKFDNQNMTLDEESLKVKIGSTEYKVSNNEDQDGNKLFDLENKDENGFTIKLLKEIDEEIEITYKTDFIIKNVTDQERKEKYPNVVILTNDNLTNELEDEATHTIRGEQDVNGSKLGTYDYDEKEFTWTIIANFNYDKIDRATLVDKLPEEHKITSITVEKGKLAANGNFEKEEDITSNFDPENNIIGKNEFSLDLGNIKEPYRITYTTEMEDGVLPVKDGENYKVTNEAKLLDESNNPNAEWKDSVEVQHSDKILDEKNGNQIGTSSGVKWDFLFNTAQSEFTSVEIKDIFGVDPDSGNVNHLIDEDSVNVYKAKVSKNSVDEKHTLLTEVDDYTLNFDQDDATFILFFEKLDHAIYVEYESTFIGIDNSPISNKLEVTYNDGKQKEDANNVDRVNFNYSSFAGTQAAEFVIVKTDEATGEPMSGVEFTLKDRNKRTLLTGTTDTKGVLDFGMQFAEGQYYLDEHLTKEQKEEHKEKKDIPFNLDVKNQQESPLFDGEKQIVNVSNEPVLEDGQKMCENFTLIVKNENGDPVEKDKKVKLVNKETGEVFEGETNEGGEVTKSREDLPAGEYEVYEDGDTEDDIYINDITVKYIGEDDEECNDEVKPEVTSISGTKTWKDGNSEDDRPDSITVNLLADGEESAEQEVTKIDNWEYSFTNLPKYTKAVGEEKHKVVYKIEEVEVDGYTPSYKETDEGFDITNVRTSKDPVEITVTKEWVGPKTDNVTINLFADGEKVDGKSIELSKNNNWTGTFKNLDKYDAEGEKIEYTVEEVEIDGYNSDVTGDAESGFTVTNTQKTYAIGDYVWIDYNSDGTQDETANAALKGVIVELYDTEGNKLDATETDENGLYIFDELLAGNYQVKFFLTDEQAKKYKFTKYNADKDATVDSDAGVEGWTEVIELNDDNGHLTTDYNAQDFKATEGIDPTWDAGVIELTDVTVNKTWKDDNDATEDRPESIKVNLKQNDTVVDTVEIEADEEGEWTHTFTGLTKYAAEEDEYEYTVSEHDVEGYAVSYDQDKFEITNTRAEEKSIEITKAWKDTEETADRPDSIEVELFRSVEGGNKESVDTYTVKSEDDWKLTIDELPAFNDEGKAYTYEIEEETVDGYKSTVDGFDITNLRVGSTKVSGTKTWKNDSEEIRPESITVNLLQNGEKIDSQEVTAQDDWEYSFTDLPEFDEEGAAYTYEVDEEEVSEYNKSIDGYDITNTRKTYALGDYVWIDRNKDGIQDENEKPLEGVKVELYDEDGEKIAETTTDKNGLYIFDELSSGNYQVKFTLTEEQEKLYRFTQEQAGDDTTVDSDANEDGWTRTIKLNEENIHLTEAEDYNGLEFKASEGIDPTWDAGVIELVDISGTKTWEKDKASDRPESITVKLLQNGEKIASQDITADDDWTYNFIGLDKFDEDGVEYDYSIEEVAVDGYEVSYDGFDITNTKLCERHTVEVNDDEDKPVADEEYTFESEDGKTTVKGKTDKDGKIVFDREDLPEGKYTVKDQDGNVVGEIEVEYNVDCQDNVSLIIVDKPTTDTDGDPLPATATQMYSWMIVGLALIALGVTLYFTRKRKKA